MDRQGSQDNGHKGVRKTGKKPQPMKFMFIDSSDHGVNAKPDKAVRSFVMHQARRQKPWSTRIRPSKNPNAETEDDDERFAVGSPSQTHSAGESTFLGYEPWEYGDPGNPNARSAQDLVSPISSRNGSLSTSSRRSSRSRITTLSRHASDCDDPDCLGGCSSSPTSLSRQDGFALGVRDPFDSLPVRTDPKMSALLDHFVSMISPRLLPVDLHQSSKVANTKWVANSLQNTTSAPFTYAVLTTSALQLQAMGTSKLEDTLYYKSQAITEINKLLSDPKTSTDDNNITAVFMLLCLEESQTAPSNKDDPDWSERQRAIHLNGLRTMIEQRGGLAGIKSNRSLQVFLLMHSMAHAISTFQPPYAVLLDGNGQPQNYDLPSFRPRPASSRLLKLYRDLKLDSELFSIINNVVVFTGDITVWYEDSKTPVDPLELQKHSCLLLYRLYSWYSKGGVEGSPENSPIDQSICMGLIIFLVKISQPYDPSYHAVVLVAVKKLRAALTKGSIFRWAKSPDLLLWTLTMGALAAQGSSEAGFFAQYCSVAFADAGFDNKTDTAELLERMKKCLWVSMLFDDEVSKLWVKMGLATGSKVADVSEDGGLISPDDVNDEDVVGLMTSTRFFSEKKS